MSNPDIHIYNGIPYEAETYDVQETQLLPLSTIKVSCFTCDHRKSNNERPYSHCLYRNNKARFLYKDAPCEWWIPYHALVRCILDCKAKAHYIWIIGTQDND